jgi:hypothetical protein
MDNTASLMIPGVRTTRHRLEVLGAVVAAIMIFVMNDIARRDWAKAVLIDPAVELLAIRAAVVAAFAQPPDFAAIIDTPWVKATVHSGLPHTELRSLAFEPAVPDPRSCSHAALKPLQPASDHGDNAAPDAHEIEAHNALVA